MIENHHQAFSAPRLKKRQEQVLQTSFKMLPEQGKINDKELHSSSSNLSTERKYSHTEAEPKTDEQYAYKRHVHYRTAQYLNR